MSEATNIGIQPLPPHKSAPEDKRMAYWYKPDEVDIRTWHSRRRRRLRAGSVLQVMVGNEVAILIPMGFFKAASTKAHHINYSDIATPRFLLPPMSKEPFVHLRTWMERLMTEKKVAPLDRLSHNVRDLSLVRAAKLLGMDKYVQHIWNYYYAVYWHDSLSYQDIDDVLKVTLSRENGFFLHMAKRIGLNELNRNIEDIEKYEIFMAMRPMLREAVNNAMIVLQEEAKRGKQLYKGQGVIY